MAAIFETLAKENVQDVISSAEWVNASPWNCIVKYEIPVIPNNPTGKSINASFEDINYNLYEHKARMVGFRLDSKDRLPRWIQCFAYRYHHLLGNDDNHNIIWTDKQCKHNCDKHDEIQIQISKSSPSGDQRLVTIHVYLTTYLITVQGTYFREWAKEEFSYLKSLVSQSDMIAAKGTLSSTPRRPPKDLDQTIISLHATANSTPDINVDEQYCSTTTPRIVTSKSTSEVYVTPCAQTSTGSIPVTKSLQMMESNLCAIVNDMINTTKNETSMLLTHIKENAQEIGHLKNLISTMKTDAARTNKETDIIRENAHLKQTMHDLQIQLQSAQSEVIQISKEKTLLEKEIGGLIHKNHCLEKETLNAAKQITCLENENKQLKLDQQEHCDNTEPKLSYSCSTHNSFEVLMEDDHKHPDLEQLQLDNKTCNVKPTSPCKQKTHDVEMVFDSHGHGLVPDKIYKWQDVGITVLEKNKKNIEGATEFIQRLDKPKHLLLGVGGNDLTTKPVEQVIDEMNSLVCSIAPGIQVHLLPALERVGNSEYNQKARRYNKLLATSHTNHQGNVSVIEISFSSSKPELFAPDNIHLNNKGRAALVRDIKSHLNPMLGIKPYREYKRDSRNMNSNRQQYRGRDSRNMNLNHQQDRGRDSRTALDINRAPLSPGRQGNLHRQKQFQDLIQKLVQFV